MCSKSDGAASRTEGELAGKYPGTELAVLLLCLSTTTVLVATPDRSGVFLFLSDMLLVDYVMNTESQ